MPTYEETSLATKTAILDAAVELSKTEGYQWITRRMVAAKAGVANGSINHHFGTVVDLKRAVMREAVRRNIPEIVRQGLADGNRDAMGAPIEIRQKAIASLVA